MNVKIKGHNVKISDTLDDFTRNKLDRLDRYLPNISNVRVDLSRQRTRRGASLSIAQITLKHERGAILRAEEKISGSGHDTMLTAINVAIDKMYRQIRRFKGKRTDKKRKPRERFMATVEELATAEDIPEVEELEVEMMEAEEEEIVRRKEIALTIMNELEAIEQMELLGHNFFVFFNADTNGTCILYKRTDGDYGMLVPEEVS